jgi:hypothetical protein
VFRDDKGNFIAANNNFIDYALNVPTAEPQWLLEMDYILQVSWVQTN